MDKKSWLVHERHCCPKHGCKYGDKDCPVVNRLTEKHNDHCEDCEHEARFPHKFVTPEEYQKGQAAIEALELLERFCIQQINSVECDMDFAEKVVAVIAELRTPDGREKIRKELGP